MREKERQCGNVGVSLGLCEGERESGDVRVTKSGIV